MSSGQCFLPAFKARWGHATAGTHVGPMCDRDPLLATQVGKGWFIALPFILSAGEQRWTVTVTVNRGPLRACTKRRRLPSSIICSLQQIESFHLTCFLVQSVLDIMLRSHHVPSPLGPKQHAIHQEVHKPIPQPGRKKKSTSNGSFVASSRANISACMRTSTTTSWRAKSTLASKWNDAQRFSGILALLSSLGHCFHWNAFLELGVLQKWQKLPKPNDCR